MVLNDDNGYLCYRHEAYTTTICGTYAQNGSEWYIKDSYFKELLCRAGLLSSCSSNEGKNASSKFQAYLLLRFRINKRGNTKSVTYFLRNFSTNRCIVHLLNSSYHRQLWCRKRITRYCAVRWFQHYCSATMSKTAHWTMPYYTLSACSRIQNH